MHETLLTLALFKAANQDTGGKDLEILTRAFAVPASEQPLLRSALAIPKE
jgi:hypothetical protein